MSRRVHMGALAGAAFFLTSFGPAAEPAAALDGLDPLLQAQAACGGRSGTAALRARLLLAGRFSRPASRAASAIPLYADLNASRLPVTTRSARARHYFNQGLMLTYGFNHAGAISSFREAQRLDPDCALCWWGEAVALGPNINAPMDDRDRAAALAALARAKALRDRASPMERALIDAAAVRYSTDPAADRAALDGAYADAMLAVARRFPTQDEIAVLAAEAVMDTSPWNYWQPDGTTPVGRSAEAVRLVEGVLARTPRHPQAAHLYIHLMENSADPRRAEAAADRLVPLAPSSGHLVHMPAHIYFARGRYADSIRVNVAAARADEAYIRATNDRGLVRYGYYPHNIHFIVMSAQMTGDMPTALREARRLRTVLDPATSARIGWVQAIDAAPFLAMAQFAPPADILAMPAPDPRLPYAAAMRHYARATAYAGLRDRAGFARELAALTAMRNAPGVAELVAQGVPVTDLIAIAEAVARGRMAYANGRYDEAIAAYRAAIAVEGRLPYMEPPFWYYPVNQSLGAALLRANRPAEASQAFRTALLQRPQNGWAVYGLAQSEAAQGNRREAQAARNALRRIWLGNPAWLRLDRL